MSNTIRVADGCRIIPGSIRSGIKGPRPFSFMSTDLSQKFCWRAVSKPMLQIDGVLIHSAFMQRCRIMHAILFSSRFQLLHWGSSIKTELAQIRCTLP
jgi:hypothetical protein